MRNPRTAALLLAGHVLLALTPIAAHAATPPDNSSGDAPPSGTYHSSYDEPYHDSHYRCMYHCQERYGYSDGYHYDQRQGDGYRSDQRQGDGYRSDGYRQRRVYHNGECYYHDDWGWHRCGYQRYRYHRDW